MKTYAVYRCLYGEDYVKESIRSIADHVDRIFVYWTNKAWGHATQCTYKGNEVVFPARFDSVVAEIESLHDPKITLIEQTEAMNPSSVPWNLYTTIVNDHLIPQYGKPDILVIPEVDHVFRSDQAAVAFEEFRASGHQVAKTRQVELWRTPAYRIPERPQRIGVVFWNLKDIDKLPKTWGNGDVRNKTPALTHFVHNFGFAVSEKVMYWKHMTALGFFREIRDSRPNEAWLDMWLNWSYEGRNKDLEISLGHEHNIPYAVPYAPQELPEPIRERINA